jgi:hypothetical protein
MPEFTRFQQMRDPDKTFDLARLDSQRSRKRVVVYDGRKPLYEFIPPWGDFSEVPPMPLFTSFASVAVTSAQDRAFHQTQRGRRDTQTAVTVLKQYELRGGRL